MSYCNECPNHDACDTGCIIGAARLSSTPYSEADYDFAMKVQEWVWSEKPTRELAEKIAEYRAPSSSETHSATNAGTDPHVAPLLAARSESEPTFEWIIERLDGHYWDSLSQHKALILQHVAGALQTPKAPPLFTGEDGRYEGIRTPDKSHRKHVGALIENALHHYMEYHRGRCSLDTMSGELEKIKDELCAVSAIAPTWVAAEKAKADAYEDAALRVEQLSHDYYHEHGSYDSSTNAWEIHHSHMEYVEALDAAVEAIRKRKAEKCQVTQAVALSDGSTAT